MSSECTNCGKPLFDQDAWDNFSTLCDDCYVDAIEVN